MIIVYNNWLSLIYFWSSYNTHIEKGANNNNTHTHLIIVWLLSINKFFLFLTIYLIFRSFLLYIFWLLMLEKIKKKEQEEDEEEKTKLLKREKWSKRENYFKDKLFDFIVLFLNDIYIYSYIFVQQHFIFWSSSYTYIICTFLFH